MIYVEYELRCDGVEGNPFGCEPPVYAPTEDIARAEAEHDGWQLNVRMPGHVPGKTKLKDFCPTHRKALC